MNPYFAFLGYVSIVLAVDAMSAVFGHIACEAADRWLETLGGPKA